MMKIEHCMVVSCLDRCYTGDWSTSRLYSALRQSAAVSQPTQTSTSVSLHFSFLKPLRTWISVLCGSFTSSRKLSLMKRLVDWW